MKRLMSLMILASASANAGKIDAVQCEAACAVNAIYSGFYGVQSYTQYLGIVESSLHYKEEGKNGAKKAERAAMKELRLLCGERAVGIGFRSYEGFVMPLSNDKPCEWQQVDEEDLIPYYDGDLWVEG